MIMACAKLRDMVVVYRQLALATDENNGLCCEDEEGTPAEMGRLVHAARKFVTCIIQAAS